MMVSPLFPSMVPNYVDEHWFNFDVLCDEDVALSTLEKDFSSLLYEIQNPEPIEAERADQNQSEVDVNLEEDEDDDDEEDNDEEEDDEEEEEEPVEEEDFDDDDDDDRIF